MTSEAIIEITPAAVNRMKQLIAKKGESNLGVRIGVKGGGCSGLSYTLALESASSPRIGGGADVTWEAEGVRIVVDPKSARFLTGMQLDYSIKNLLEGGWVFDNPNAARSCGCGTSFTPKA